jgi:hypothetical protein
MEASTSALPFKPNNLATAALGSATKTATGQQDRPNKCVKAPAVPTITELGPDSEEAEKAAAAVYIPTGITLGKQGHSYCLYRLPL